MVFAGFCGVGGRVHLVGLVAGGFCWVFLQVEKKRGLIGWGFLMESNCILNGREAFIHYFSSYEKKRLNRNVCRPM